jgi:hypothetical protein
MSRSTATINTANSKAELPSAKLRGKAMANSNSKQESNYYCRKTCEGPNSNIIDDLGSNLHGWSRLGTKHLIVALSPQHPRDENTHMCPLVFQSSGEIPL